MIDEAGECLRLLSGRPHRVFTGLVVVTPRGAFRKRVVEARVRFKRLSNAEIEASYLASGEWSGKAGGYAIQGLAGAFVVKLVGSYSSVVGLPLHETAGAAAGRRVSAAFRDLGELAPETDAKPWLTRHRARHASAQVPDLRQDAQRGL